MARVEMGVDGLVLIAPAQAAPEAFFELGCMYAAGRNVGLDLVTAHKWFNVAAARGHAPAAARRAELAAEMSVPEIATAQREARLWLTRH
jgi:TPR repeat protein